MNQLWRGAKYTPLREHAPAKTFARSKCPASALNVMYGRAGGPEYVTSIPALRACASRPVRSFSPVARILSIPPLACSSLRFARLAAIGTALVKYEPVKNTSIAACFRLSRPRHAASG